MKKFLRKIIWFSLISFYFLQIEKVQAIVPYYYYPTIKNLEKQSLYIGKNAYQLLYFGQFEESLNLAKLAVKINAKDEKLWLILAEAQLANKQYKKALNSLNKAVDMHFCQYIYFAFVNFLLLGNSNKELLVELLLFEKSKNRQRRSRLFFLKTSSSLNFFILYICLYVPFPHPWFDSF